MSGEPIAPDRADEPPRLYGLLAEFDNVDDVVAAAGKVRQAGYTRWDVHTPFPIHGLDDAMGLRATRLPWIVFAAGLIGAGLALLLQWWTNAVNYRFIISGKPYFSLPANIPVTFELTVLVAALAAFFGMLGRNKLPQLHHPLLANARFRRATTDRFFIVVECEDPRFDPQQTRRLLASLGATVTEVREG
jgi:hypothetical protein